MKFEKYQHIERYGTDEVRGIDVGRVHVFPKIDGTNASVWYDGAVETGSRRKHLSLSSDNAGFCEYAKERPELIEFFKAHSDLRLFGEWLVPHTLRTYRDEAWRRFYVFDVAVDNPFQDAGVAYLPYPEYQPILEEHGIEYIPPLAIIQNPTYEQLVALLEKNDYLIQDGKGAGEGIVIKNYGYRNAYGRQTWAKIVRAEFKEKHCKVMGAPEQKGKAQVEDAIAQMYVTQALCEKVKAKIEGFGSKDIPRLLNTVFYDIVREETWNILKKFKDPTINFKTLRFFVFNRVKELMPGVF